MSETAVRDAAHSAEVLITRLPVTWAAFAEGEVSIQNARSAVETVLSLPDDPDLWTRLDEQIAPLASTLAPARFRARIRVIRERLQPRSLAERHQQARTDRRVVVEHEADGMCWFGLYAPAEQVQRIMVGIAAQADRLASAPDEVRTHDQLRADVAADILLGIGQPRAAGVSVGVLVPVMTLLGRDEPATLEGYGPIDADSARRLAAHAPSFFRILTHPITGTILDVDRTTYRVPADLARLVRLRDPLCVAPGCGRRASDCELDHRTAWADGGGTSDDNLSPLCHPHHRVKHRSKWRLRKKGERLEWTSPTGVTHDVDPPPF